MTDSESKTANAAKKPETPEVPGRFQLSKEEFEAVQAENDDLDLMTVGVKGLGVVVLKPATRPVQNRFMERILGAKSDKHKKHQVLEELARCSVAWPSVEDLEAEIDRKRKYMAWVDLGNQAAKVAGLDVEEIEGN